MKKRIWELDAFRGLCIIGMVIVHLVYDLVDLYRIVDWNYPEWFAFIKDWGGILFLLLSGICVTLGSRSVRRGLIVLGCGVVCTVVTYGMYYLELSGKSIIIYFGVLHCLGICMLLWPLLKKSPVWLLVVLGVVLTAAGFYVETLRVQTHWLIPFGILYRGFASSDYFPLLPNLGYFLLGAALGKLLYRQKQTLFPKINGQNIILRFLQFCGRHSLWIYLLHQPVLSGLCFLLTL